MDFEVINDFNEIGLNIRLVDELKKGKLKISTAESLTGGMISEMITQVSGSSSVIECGICSYSNRIKHEILNVKNETLEKYTEYSIQTAKEMADGIRKLSGADIGISTTGIAGPDGGTEEKPVGLVYIGISRKLGTTAFEFRFRRYSENEREILRKLSALNALSMALSIAEKINSEK